MLWTCKGLECSNHILWTFFHFPISVSRGENCFPPSLPIYFGHHFNPNESLFKALYLDSLFSALTSLSLLWGCLSTGNQTRKLKIKSKLMFLCYFQQSYWDIIHVPYLVMHYAHFNTFLVYSQSCETFVAMCIFRIFLHSPSFCTLL